MKKHKLVPVLELDQDDHVSDTAAIPLHELDAVVGELASDYDFGLGELQVSGAKNAVRELGKLKLPKVAASIAMGAYKKLEPGVEFAVKKAISDHCTSKGKKPVVLAKKKSTCNSQALHTSLSSIYKELKRQGKLVDSMVTKKAVTHEHNKLMAQDKFRGDVSKALKKLDTQISKDVSGSYFDRWNKLKAVSGVAVHER
jgi:hypothetical protein